MQTLTLPADEASRITGVTFYTQDAEGARLLGFDNEPLQLNAYITIPGQDTRWNTSGMQRFASHVYPTQRSTQR